MDDLRPVPVGAYRARVVWFRCHRCQRFASRHRFALEAAYGPDTTLGTIALRMAAEGASACPLAHGDASACSARPEAAPVEQWATLEDALHGRWQCLFHCERRHAALKAASACPGPIRLSVPSLIVALGAQFPLGRLVGRARCPLCGSEAFSIEWRTPPPAIPRPPEPDFEADYRAAVDVELSRRAARRAAGR